MYCPNCGFNNSDGVMFCANCGASIKRAESHEVTEPVVKKKKIGLGKEIITVVLVAAIVISLFMFAGNKDTKPYIVYIKDNQMNLAFEGEKEHITLNEEVIKGYNMLSSKERYTRKRNIANSLSRGFENKIFCREMISADASDYDYTLFYVEGKKVEKISLPYQFDDSSLYSMIPSKDYSKAYFKYKNNIYLYEFDSIKKIASGAYQFFYCQDTDRLVYTKENDNEGSYNKDFYVIDSHGESNLIAENMYIEYSDKDTDVYVYSQSENEFYTYINGENNKLAIPYEIMDDAEDINVIRAFNDGTVLLYVRRKVNEKSEWSHYLSKNNEYKLISDYSKISDDGKMIYCFEKTSPENSDEYYGTVTKYKVDGLELTKVAAYDEVRVWNLLPDNDLIIWRNRTNVKEYIYVYDLYYNNEKIASDVYRYNEGGGKDDTIHLTVMSEDYIVYLTNPRSIGDNELIYTLNVYDGKETKEIGYDVRNSVRVTEDGKVIFLADWNSADNAGKLMVYDGKTCEEIASDVSNFYAPNFVERVPF